MTTRITLSKLVLRNFKGIRDLTVNFGSTTEVYGDNATGKTTLFDAFLWLLFDKDSNNRKDFDIKTLDADGNVVPGLEHEVEGTLVVDGRVLVLRKVYAEKWVKKRGSATSEFTGHSTDYFIDGVPVKQKEYKDHIDDLVDEGVFKLLTSPAYFNEQLSWQDRRRVLLEVCGDVSDDEVITSSKTLSKLPNILNGRSIDDHRKVIAARRSDINKELEKIPVRIDEAERSKPDVEGLNESALQAQIDDLKQRVQAKDEELSRIRSGGEIAEQENRLRIVDGQLLDLKNNSQAELMEQISQQRQFVAETEEAVSHLFSEIGGKGFEIEQNTRSINLLRSKVDELRQAWVRENDTQFGDAHVDDACPACGQSLPTEKVQAAVDKAVADFNLRKSRTLESLQNEAVAAKNRIDELETRNQTLQSDVDTLEARVKSEQRKGADAKATLDKLQSQVTDVTQSLEYRAKVMERQSVADKLAKLRESMLGEVDRVTSELNELRAELRQQETKFASFAQVRSLDARITDLKQQERELAAEYERLEEELYLTEEFIRTKVNLLESRINSKFRYARFKLFEQQVNGGLSETCQTLYQGVPYGSGLNNAARINVGLDIIETLSTHYGIWAPCLIDNAEAITNLPAISSQMIALYVSEKDKTLRVESEDKVAMAG